MNILHYTIGLPPTRMGGSIQYANDLIHGQAKRHNVLVLTCGDTLFKPRKARIKYRHDIDGIKVFSLENPLTPTLIYGTSNPCAQHKHLDIDYDNIRNFILTNKIEVLHVHTLQGLHSDIVRYIKGLGVKLFYTAHDFHGICPHYNLLDYNGDLCCTRIAAKCAVCNLHQPSEMFLRLASSELYQFLKSKNLLNYLKRRKLKTVTVEKKQADKPQISPDSHTITEYQELLDYYTKYFQLFDKIHFNSNQTKEVFTSFLPDAKGEVINIVTRGIRDKRKPLEASSAIVLGFIGSLNDYKGFPMLKKAMLELYAEGIDNIHLKVYGGGNVGQDPEHPNIEYCPPYKYSELSEILYSLDGTIVPSRCYETFSLVTLETIAHGRPAIVSDHVGAKDLVACYSKESIFSSSDELKTILRNISHKDGALEKYANSIMTHPWKISMDAHVEDIIQFYKS